MGKMRRDRAFDILRGLASGDAPVTLTPDQRRALGEMLPEVLELPVDWDESSKARPGEVETECEDALLAIANEHRLGPCGEPGDGCCYFPRCLADACEAVPLDSSAAAEGPTAPGSTPGTTEKP